MSTWLWVLEEVKSGRGLARGHRGRVATRRARDGSRAAHRHAPKTRSASDVRYHPDIAKLDR